MLVQESYLNSNRDLNHLRHVAFLCANGANRQIDALIMKRAISRRRIRARNIESTAQFNPLRPLSFDEADRIKLSIHIGRTKYRAEYTYDKAMFALTILFIYNNFH